MNVGQLKKLIADLPDDTMIYRETGDHDLLKPFIEKTHVYNDKTYGIIESCSSDLVATEPALIIR